MASSVPIFKDVETSRERMSKKPMVEVYKPKVIYPATLVHDHSNDEMKKCIDMFKQISINISL